eukprot:2854914-Prymnesium_polylepis.1
MTNAFSVVGDTSRDTWELSDRATKQDSPVGITGSKVKGHRRTFRFAVPLPRINIRYTASKFDT